MPDPPCPEIPQYNCLELTTERGHKSIVLYFAYFHPYPAKQATATHFRPGFCPFLDNSISYVAPPPPRLATSHSPPASAEVLAGAVVSRADVWRGSHAHSRLGVRCGCYPAGPHFIPRKFPQHQKERKKKASRTINLTTDQFPPNQPQITNSTMVKPSKPSNTPLLRIHLLNHTPHPPQRRSQSVFPSASGTRSRSAALRNSAKNARTPRNTLNFTGRRRTRN